MKPRITLIILLLIIVSLQVICQEEMKPDWRQKTYFGGNLWLSIGNITYIEATPTVGYWITPRFTCATGFIYNFYKDDYFNTKSNIYGGRFFTRYILIENISKMLPIDLNGSIFAQGEIDHLILESNNPNIGRFGYDKVYIGGGIRQPIGEKGGVYISVLYNLNDMGYFTTNNPEVRVGIYF